MATLLHFPRPWLHESEQGRIITPPDPDTSGPPHLTLVQKGPTSMGVIRRPFVGEIKTFQSPENPDVTFDIKRCSVKENIERQNLASTMRYVERDKTGETGTELVTERDYPVGSMNLATVRMGLAGWNLVDEQERPIPVTERTIQDYLSQKEFNFVLAKVYEVNPMWRSGGADDEDSDSVKNS